LQNGTIARLLFVCTGNACRSVMAEQLCRRHLAKEGVEGVTVSSAGVAARPEMSVPAEVPRALAPHGVDELRHRPRLLSREMVEEADLILVMDAQQQTTIALRFPAAVGKTRVFKSYVGLTGPSGIADPIGRPQKDYDACARDILAAVVKLVDQLKKGPA